MAMLHSLIARRRFGPQTQWRPLRKTLTIGWGLTICLWLGPPWFNYWFSFTLAYNRISHEYSSLFIIVINLIFMFSLWCIDWVGSLYANRIFMSGVSLTLCCFVVYSMRRFVVCLSVCHFVLVFFSPFSIAITSLGEERALSAFRTFVRFVLV